MRTWNAGRFGLIAVMATAGALAGCSKSNNAGSTNTPSAGSTGSASAPSPTGTDVASQIQALITKAESGENTNFKATYSVTVGGSNETLTFEQKGSDQLIATNGIGEFISTSSTSAFCLTSSTPICYAEPATSAGNPMAAMLAIAEPKAVLTAIQSAEGQALANSQGYTITMGSQTHGGASDTCATIAGQGHSVVYCFNSDGVVAYESTTGSTLTLTSYTT
ncbi:MAG TPA: hypothetical protein VKY26_02055, partial [Actinomycetota bacterium]|nr:hypothetical protein [Actinomycetota bacterium]